MKRSVWVNCIYFDCVLSYHFYSLLGSLSVIFNYIRAAKLYFSTSSLLAQSPLTYLLRLHMYLVVAISSVAFPGRFVSSLADCTRSIFILLSGTIFTLLGLFWPQCNSVIVDTFAKVLLLFRACFYRAVLSWKNRNNFDDSSMTTHCVKKRCSSNKNVCFSNIT